MGASVLAAKEVCVVVAMATTKSNHQPWVAVIFRFFPSCPLSSRPHNCPCVLSNVAKCFVLVLSDGAGFANGAFLPGGGRFANGSFATYVLVALRNTTPTREMLRRSQRVWGVRICSGLSHSRDAWLSSTRVESYANGSGL